MIELLIAMVVVAVGVLGIGRMQITMVRQNQSALLRSQASILAYDMIDRLRIDRQAALAGSYDRALGDAAPATGTVEGVELNAWLTTLAATLPSGDGAIVSNGSVTEITVRWDDSRGAQAPLVFTTAVAI